MAIAVQTQSIIKAGLDASSYQTGARQIEQANRQIAQSGEQVVRSQQSHHASLRATERAMQNVERRLGLQVARQREYERELQRVNAAEMQGIRTAEQAAQIRAALAARYRATATALRGVSEETRTLAPLMRELETTMAGFARGAGTLGASLARIGPLGLAAAAALGALSLGARASVSEFQQTEQRTLRLEAVLRATGNAAGVTTTEIVELAGAIQRATTATDNQVLESAAALATFRSVSGQTFRDVLRLGADMAEVFGGDMRSSVMSLARALEDPANGLTALRRSGIMFTDTQRDMIQEMVRVGDVARAQKAILAEVEGQLGGASAGAAGGVAGAAKRVSDAWSDLLKRFAETSGIADAARASLSAIADTLNAIDRVIAPIDPRVRLEAIQEQLRAETGAFSAMEAAIARATGQPVSRGGGRLDAARLQSLQREELRLLGEIEVREREIALARIAGHEAQARAAEAAAAERRRALNEVLAGLQREVEQAALATAERARLAAIEKAIADARKANPSLTADDEAQVRRLVIARLDIEAATRAQEDAARAAAQEMKRLDEQSLRTAESVVERLLKASQTEWETWTQQVAEAEAAMTRLNLSAEKQQRIRQQLNEMSPTARAMRAAEEQRRRENEREAEEFARIWQRATDTAVERSGDFFFELFSGRAVSIGDTLRRVLLRAVADAAANFIVAPIITPVISTIGSAVGGIIGVPGGGGGVGGIGNLLGFGSSAYQAATGQPLLGGLGGSIGRWMSTPIFGHSAASAGMFAEGSAASMGLSASQASILAGTGPTIGSLLGAGGIGFGAGALLGAFGANRTFSSIGGAGLGALGGFLVGGPIGAVVGGIGGIIGGLVGGSRKPGFAGGTSLIGVDPATGMLTVIGATGKRFDPTEVERAAAQQIAPLNTLLQRSGVTVSAAGLGLDPLTGRSPFIGYGIGLGDGARYGQDLDSLIRRIAQSGRFESDDAITRRVLASGGITGAESLERGLGFAEMFRALAAGADTTSELERAMTKLREQLDQARRSAVEFGFSVEEINTATREAFERDIRRGIVAIENPLQLAMEDFERAAKLRLDVARELGANLVEVERLTQLERARVQEQFQSQISSGLRRLVDEVSFGNLSSAAPERQFFLALTRFNQAERAALENPTSAQALSEFESAARSVLPIARNFLGTSQRYGELESRVLGTAVRLDPTADPASIAAARIVDGIAQVGALQIESTNAVRDAVRALQQDFARLALQVEALARRAA